MAKNTEPEAVSPKSVMSTMFSWPIFEAALASCMKRATRSALRAKSSRQDLERDLLLDEDVLGEVDDAHAAFAELADDAIAIGDGRADVGIDRAAAPAGAALGCAATGGLRGRLAAPRCMPRSRRAPCPARPWCR